MKFSEIKELISLVKESNLAEFKMKDKEFELSIRTDKFEKNKNSNSVLPAHQSVLPISQVQQPYLPQTPVAPQPELPPKAAADTAAPVAEAPANDEAAGLLEIKSPIVGTFYRSSSPEKGPYVSVGDRVEEGMVVCIVEAMKLFNEIESEISGVVVQVLLEDAQPVEYDQPLFLVDPRG